MYAATIPPLVQTVTALSAILAKAEAHCAEHKIDEAALTGFRLFPDMLPFTRQVQLASDFACRTPARLTGAEVPSHPDVETTLAQLQTRLATALAYLGSFTEPAFDGAATREITLKMRHGELSFTGQVFLSQFALPNFYFHATTAYNILRHNGLPLGKRDFMGA
jgi:uncharacterized protein